MRANIDENVMKQNFFNKLVGQAGIALENAALFGNLQATNDELCQAYEVTISQSLPQAEVLAHIQEHSGTHFDPQVVKLFLKVIEAQGES